MPIEERLDKIEAALGLGPLSRDLTLEERVRRLELLLDRLGVTLGDIGTDWKLGGWTVDETSIFSKGTPAAIRTLIKMYSPDPYILVQDASSTLQEGSTLLEDTFTDTDGTALPSHSPDTGSAWSGDTEWEIQSNRVEDTETSSIITREVSNTIGTDASIKVTFDLYLPASPAEGDYLIVDLRYVDNSNRLAVYIEPADSSDEILVRYADGDSSVMHGDVSSGTGLTWNTGATANAIKIVLYDDVVKVYLNSSLVVTSNTLTWGAGSTTFRLGGVDIDTWSLDTLSVVGVSEVDHARVKLGKQGTGDAEYGLAAWDSAGNKLLDEEGLGDGLFMYDEFTVAATPSFTYTLTETPATDTIVTTLNGLLMRSDEFSVSSTTLTIDSGQVTLTENDTITAHYSR